MDTLKLIQSMRVTDIPTQSRGLWYICRIDFSTLPNSAAQRWGIVKGAFDAYPDIAPIMTSLCRWTEETIHLGHGEAVMSDDPKELRKHFPILLHARGRVLVSGLGLGCVVRGLLALPHVKHIDVVEKDRDVLAMVLPTLPRCARLTVHMGDAVTFPWPDGTRWDYAWHDIWSEEPHTQILHMKLLMRYRKMVGRQGAWGMPRFLQRKLRASLGDSLL